VTNEANASGGREQTTADSVVVLVISCLAAVLVIAGISYAAGTGERHKAALAAAGCEPNQAPSGLQCTTVQTLNSRYEAITTPAIQQLDTDVAAYTANEGDNLAAAEAALTAEVASENALDTSLARFPFPPTMARLARVLIQANDARATLTAEQARSSSLSQLWSFNERFEVASAAVQTDMSLLGKALESRPVSNQEP
jgi:hypothetical protein